MEQKKPMTGCVMGFAAICNKVSGGGRNNLAILSRHRFTVGAHDLIIAATAISMDYTVITSNWRDYEKIEGLRLEVRG